MGHTGASDDSVRRHAARYAFRGGVEFYSNGVKLGRKEATDTTQKVQELRSEGLSQSKVAKHLGVSVSTVKRHWNKG